MAFRATRIVVASQKWGEKTLHDVYFKKAKAEGYVSRAAYKLKEIQDKHKVIKRGGRVLDLGCSPGAWLQVACQEIGPRGGCVLGVDLQAVEVPERFCDSRVHAIQADARTLSPDVLTEYAPQGFDTVLSDMLHFTSGVNDVELSLELAGTALNIATGYHFDLYGDQLVQQLGYRHQGYLRPGGALVMKVYEGSGVNEFIRDMQKYFNKVVRLRVDASRSMSREFYAIGLGRKRPRALPGSTNTTSSTDAAPDTSDPSLGGDGSTAGSRRPRSAGAAGGAASGWESATGRDGW